MKTRLVKKEVILYSAIWHLIYNILYPFYKPGEENALSGIIETLEKPLSKPYARTADSNINIYEDVNFKISLYRQEWLLILDFLETENTNLCRIALKGICREIRKQLNAPTTQVRIPEAAGSKTLVPTGLPERPKGNKVASPLKERLNDLDLQKLNKKK